MTTRFEWVDTGFDLVRPGTIEAGDVWEEHEVAQAKADGTVALLFGESGGTVVVIPSTIDGVRELVAKLTTAVNQMERRVRDEAEVARFDAIVKQGAEALDAHPAVLCTWRDDIDVVTLRMQTLDQCVLGQLFGSYDNAPGELQEHPAFDMPGPELVQIGSSYDYYRHLDAAWKRYLSA